MKAREMKSFFCTITCLTATIVFLIGCAEADSSTDTAMQRADERAVDLTLVVLGDTAYIADQYDEYEALIQEINALDPDFSVHIGDTRGDATTPSTNQGYQTILEQFEAFEGAVVYTPADNEWTDTWEPISGGPYDGGFDPEERLGKLREVFFSDAKSLGKDPISLKRQADIDPQHSEMVENAYWWHDQILCFTVHIPGSNNGWTTQSDTPDSEFQRRESANLAWINDCFDRAAKEKAKAVLVFFHAELDPVYPDSFLNNKKKQAKIKRHQIGEVDAFQRVRELIKARSISCPCPVLQVHGDDHRFTFSQPYRVPVLNSSGFYDEADHVMRLQTFGSPHVRAVRVDIDLANPWPFTVSPIMIASPSINN